MKLKNARDEHENLKGKYDLKSEQLREIKKDLESLIIERETREREFIEKEVDYKDKLNDMGAVVEKLENKIGKAVKKAEEERKQREEVLRQLLGPSDIGPNILESPNDNSSRNSFKLESNKWRDRAKSLTEELEYLQEQFSRYRSKNMIEREGIISTVKSAKAEQILNLKKELSETYKDKLTYQSKLNDLSSELDLMREQKLRVQKDFDSVNQELRGVKKEMLVKKSEIDWLRNALGSKARY